MKFLAGSALTTAIKKLIANERKVNAAIAYWGHGSLSLLGLNARRNSVRIICCLKDGKSDPAVISKFGDRARHNDKLHAKVVWTRTAAIVGSANASSNGLPEEEGKITALIEAGVYVDDRRTLKLIGSWFEKEFKSARRVTKTDLKQAQDARNERIWSGSNTRIPTRSLIEAIESGRKEFLNQRIYLMLFDSYITPKRQKAARRWARTNQPKIRKRLVMPSVRWNWLDFYEDWPPLPKEAYLIDVFHKGKRTAVNGPTKTFHLRVAWDGIQYVRRGAKVRFGYKITRDDKRVIRLAAKRLWDAAYAKNRRGILPLAVAAPILLKYAGNK